MNIRFSLTDLPEVAQQIIAAAGTLGIFAFEGGLGAGKTTLIRAICLQLGVAESAISSPTFSIINEYKPAPESGFEKIYHMDWYRLQRKEEALEAGVEEALLDATALCLIEWPQQAQELLYMPHLKLQLYQEAGNNHTRSLEIRRIEV